MDHKTKIVDFLRYGEKFLTLWMGFKGTYQEIVVLWLVLLKCENNLLNELVCELIYKFWKGLT